MLGVYEKIIVNDVGLGCEFVLVVKRGFNVLGV